MVVAKTKSLVQEETSLQDVYEKSFQDFCDEIDKGTEIIVIEIPTCPSGSTFAS